MQINLLNSPITLIKVDDNSQHLDTRLMGHAEHSANTVYFDGRDPFSTLMHEIFHFYLFRVGIVQMDNYSQEATCDMFGSCTDILMKENGSEIFFVLREFAEGR